MAWTEFGEDQSQCEQRGLYSQEFPLHSMIFLLEIGAISQLQSPEWEVWGILVVQGVEWGFVHLLQRVSADTPPLFISSDLWMKALKAHKAWISMDISAGKCLFLPPWEAECSRAVRDESWASSMENHNSNHSDQECSALPRETFQAEGFQDISAQGGSCQGLQLPLVLLLLPYSPSAKNQQTEKKKYCIKCTKISI